MSPLCVVLCKSHECVCVSKLDPPSFGNITLLDLVFLDYNNLYPYVCFCAVAFSLPSKTFILRNCYLLPVCFFCWQHTIFCCVHLAMEGWERWFWWRVRCPFVVWLMRGSHCYCLYFGSRAGYPMGRVAPPFLLLTSPFLSLTSPGSRGVASHFSRSHRGDGNPLPPGAVTRRCIGGSGASSY